MTEEKRKRSPNWLASEKILLLELVQKHYGVIENKKTDGVAIKRKLAEWRIISKEYNRLTTHCLRSPKNLKNQWESMKKNAKRKESLSRMHKVQTDGGPENTAKDDPLHAKIILCLNQTRAVGLHNPVRNKTNAQLPEEQPFCNEDFEIEIDEHKKKNEVSATQEPVSQDWGDYTPQLIRQKHKSWILRGRPMYTASSSSLEHKKKMEATEYQISGAEEDILNSNEEHELNLQIKREQLKQEKIKTRILLLDLKMKKKEQK